MDAELLNDALDSLTRRDLERLQERIAARLIVCVICGGDGAEPMKIVGQGPMKGRNASLMVCKPCFEKHRLPESRAEA